MKRFELRMILLALSLITAAQGFSQSTEQEKIAEMEKMRENRRQMEAMRTMDSAIVMIKNAQYDEADILLRRTLKTIRTVPSDLAYHFGENSYHMGKYRQAIDWLTKYIQLKGTTGSYSSSAVDYLKKSEQGLLNQINKQKAESVEVLARDYDIDCGPSGKVVCPVCLGKTVIIRKTYLGEKYSTCPHCDQHGFLTCAQYNQLLRGQLQTVR